MRLGKTALVAIVASLTAALAATPVAWAADAPVALGPPAPLDAAISVDPAAPRTDWWAGLADPQLDRLVAYALRRNRDLRAAEAEVRRARALAKLQAWSLLPSGALGLAGGRARVATIDTQGGFVEADGAFAWEIDVFGRLRAGAKAAKYEALGAEEARRGAMVAIAAQLASTYVDLRGAQLRLAAVEANATAQAETLRLTRLMRDLGRATPLDVTRAQAQLEATRSQGPLLRAEIEDDLAALDVLAAGLEPQMKAALRQPEAVPAPPTQLAVGTPEDLLRRRPDIREAAARLEADRARVRAARVDWWPRLSYIANATALGGQFAELGDNRGFSFSLGPRIDWPALDVRRNALRVEAAKAGAEADYERYENLVLSGARDLDAALADLAGALQAQASLTSAVDAARKAADISRLRYREGADAFFNVLDAERTLAGFEDNLAAARARSAIAYVRLGQTVGAGWSDDPPDNAPRSLGS
jgi:multidrug efflux system outer membrane protein